MDTFPSIATLVGITRRGEAPPAKPHLEIVFVFVFYITCSLHYFFNKLSAWMYMNHFTSIFCFN